MMHGWVAQMFLVLVVALSVRLGLFLSSGGIGSQQCSGRARILAWMALGVVYLQLIFGATMRHLGAGLAISTFPEVSSAGGFIPVVHGMHTDINFAHTRVGALLVLVLVLSSSWYILKQKTISQKLRMAARRSIVLVLVQVILGILVIWHLKPPTLATLHVVVGAAVMASLAAVLVLMYPLPSGGGE